jgi:uncharacterized protein DUF1877
MRLSLEKQWRGIHFLLTGELRGRYDVRVMTEAMNYPEVWQREGAAALEWVLAGYKRLVEFHTRALSQGYVVVLAIL